MTRLAILATILLASTAAFGEDAPKPDASGNEVAKPVPVPASKWMIELDQGDINLLDACVVELPKRVADPFIAKLKGNLKPVAGK